MIYGLMLGFCLGLIFAAISLHVIATRHFAKLKADHVEMAAQQRDAQVAIDALNAQTTAYIAQLFAEEDEDDPPRIQ